LGVLFLAGGLAAGIPACGDDSPSDGGGDGDGTFNGTIRVLDNAFSPRSVTISAGDSVTWRWEGSNSHTVTHGTDPGNLGGLFNEGPKSSGTFGYRFDNAGTYRYFCLPHFSAGMTGSITVNP
jgi:plastocyanin